MAYLTIKPGEVLTYSRDWIDKIGSGATIQSAEHSITPADGSPAPAVVPVATVDTETFLEVSGCEAGNVYEVKSIILDSDGDRHVSSFTLRCDG